MQAIIETLGSINNYIGYLFIVIFIVVVVMLVRVLLALIRLSHSATDFSLSLESVDESLGDAMMAIRKRKERTRSFFSKVLKTIALYKLSRIYLSRKKRAELRKAKDEAALIMKRDRYVRRLLRY